ncbi:MAG: hypothetical protein KGM49_07435 [Sphingomonadales bacterium]|nr:hypothetical protein [Sphingomonadales bacterium]
MPDEATRPFLINQDADGNYRLTVRDVRYNSQGYPIVTGVLQSECFVSANAAKAWARDNFNARSGQYAVK